MKQNWAWLRLVEADGEFPVPTSEAKYLANIDKIDAVMPYNGGVLQDDGTWLQESWKIDPPWPQSIPNLARNAGQQYIPSVSSDKGLQMLNVLDNPALQETAANELVALALSGRFDSPWDGVFVEFEGVPSSYKNKLSDFLYILSYKVRSAGLPFCVSNRGRRTDDPTGGMNQDDSDDAYSHDLSVVSQVADYFHMHGYTYWNPNPRSNAPYWWIDECIQFALSQGIEKNKMLLGIANYSRYRPFEWNDGLGYDLTYDSAIKMAAEFGVPIYWVERNENGLVRERASKPGYGTLWVLDGDTFQHGLNLIDQHDLLGVGHFVAGCGDDLHWQVIEKWRSQ